VRFTWGGLVRSVLFWIRESGSDSYEEKARSGRHLVKTIEEKHPSETPMNSTRSCTQTTEPLSTKEAPKLGSREGGRKFYSKTERTSPPHVNLTAYIQLRGELLQTTLSKEFVAVYGLRKMVRLKQRVGGATSWGRIFMRHKVFLNELLLSTMHNGREMQRTTIDMFHWANPKKQNTAHKERRANRDRELFRMARE